ncbi:MAG TPA: PEP-CTERM sorting domain-containing protein [Stellaceae bacterium]|nr:PEP-CTERM sorting domain-containing protein [Stellaceae bacterium]
MQAFYYNSTFAGPEGEIPVGGSTTDPTSLAAPVNYQQGAADGSTIAVTDLQIVITNVLSGASFCLSGAVGTACTDQIDGFDFKFTGESITGVSVDAASATGMQPVTGTFQGNTHNGLQLISPNEIQVDLTGDLPNVNDQLILDLSFNTNGNGGGGTTVPEPASLLILGVGLGAIFVGRRRSVGIDARS